MEGLWALFSLCGSCLSGETVRGGGGSLVHAWASREVVESVNCLWTFKTTRLTQGHRSPTESPLESDSSRRLALREKLTSLA